MSHSNPSDTGSDFFDGPQEENDDDKRNDLSPEDPSTENEGEIPSEAQTPLMSARAQRVVIYLMRQGSFLSSDNKQLYLDYLSHESDIHRYLNTINIEVRHGEQDGLVYIRGKEASVEDFSDGENDFERHTESTSVSIIESRTLNLFDTLLLLTLRTHLQEREIAGETRVLIDYPTIENKLRPFLPILPSESIEKKRLNGSLDKMKKKKLLKSLRGSGDLEESRYRIMPLLRHEFGVDQANDLLEQYKELLKKQPHKEQGS